jgi:hypothetical protein
MTWPKLRDLALYFLQAFLWIGAIYMGVAIFGGMAYLHDASKIDYADVRPKMFSILRTEIILAGVGASFLFGIGTVRTYLARRGPELRKQTIRQPRSYI